VECRHGATSATPPAPRGTPARRPISRPRSSTFARKRSGEDRVAPILADVRKAISFGAGRVNDERVEHELFDDGDAWRESDMGEYRQKAVAQLGTVGSGNHYVDLMADEDGFVWIGVHFGSRGSGHTSATRYLKAAGGKDGMHVAPAVVDEDSELGAVMSPRWD
jgi:tRNA-splicing ligase RtcB